MVGSLKGLLFYPPIALADVIYFYINGTSWGYDLFRLIYNPLLQMVVSLVGIAIEIYLGYYIIKHKKYYWFKWFKNEPKRPKIKTVKKKQINIFISYANEDLNQFRIPEIAKKHVCIIVFVRVPMPVSFATL